MAYTCEICGGTLKIAEDASVAKCEYCGAKQPVPEAVIEEKASFRSQGLCQHCGGTLKGLFTKKCTSCGKQKDY